MIITGNQENFMAYNPLIVIMDMPDHKFYDLLHEDKKQVSAGSVREACSQFKLFNIRWPLKQLMEYYLST